MRRLGSVQQKISCVFVPEVKQEPSKKRVCQEFQVVATEHLNPVAAAANVQRAVATEKLDGTCCYVSVRNGQPWLWARLDRKPNKQGEKRFKKYQHSNKSSKGFTWNVEEDFKTVPDAWIPAHGVKHLNGHPVPDQQGHIPGWVPVEKDNKQYCWHSSVLDSDSVAALVLRPSGNMEDALEIVAVPLADLLEQTLELIGTNVNGNPYGLGSKKEPLHFLVPHGSILAKNPPPVELQRLLAWFQDGPGGNVEGIVWHCSDGTLLKLHRHHLNLSWAGGAETFLGSKPVDVCVDRPPGGLSHDPVERFSRMNGRKFRRLQDVQYQP